MGEKPGPRMTGHEAGQQGTARDRVHAVPARPSTRRRLPPKRPAAPRLPVEPRRVRPDRVHSPVHRRSGGPVVHRSTELAPVSAT
jgi:hypothetical protein